MKGAMLVRSFTLQKKWAFKESIKNIFLSSTQHAFFITVASPLLLRFMTASQRSGDVQVEVLFRSIWCNGILNWSIFLSLFAYLGVFLLPLLLVMVMVVPGKKINFLSHHHLRVMFTQYNLVDTKGKLSIEFILFKNWFL